VVAVVVYVISCLVVLVDGGFAVAELVGVYLTIMIRPRPWETGANRWARKCWAWLAWLTVLLV
jgi:hypothetical protein